MSNMRPPKDVQRAYRDGLERHARGETGEGLEPITVRMARRFADGKPTTEEWARKGARWWARNARFAKAESGTPAYAAAQLWGGRDWFTPIVQKMDEQSGEGQFSALINGVAERLGLYAAPTLSQVHITGAEDTVRKYSKDEVGYHEATGLRRCGNCRFFQPPDACEVVEGGIMEDDVCDRWRSAERSYSPISKAHDYGMIAFYPSNNITPISARLTHPNSRAVEQKDLHMTLVYLGPEEDLGVDRSILELALKGFAGSESPIVAKAGGLIRFSKEGDDETQAVCLVVDSPFLPAMRQRLMDVLEIIGLKPDSEHGFVPHMTVAYLHRDEPTPRFDQHKQDLIFDKIALAWGDDVKSFNLVGGQRFYVPIQKDTYGDILLFPVSTFYRDGKKREFTAAQAEEMARNFKDNVLGRTDGKLPINAEHERWRGRIGYVTEVVVKDGQPFVKLDEAEPGALDKFDYISPEIRWLWTHPYTGQEYRNVLMGVAATNYPFLLSKTAIAKSLVWDGGEWFRAITEVTPAYLKDAPQAELLSMHRRTHQLWGANFAGNTKETTDGLTREDVVSAHALLVEEMGRRGIQHETPIEKAGNLDPSKLPTEIMVTPQAVAVVGSTARGEAGGDVDVLFRFEVDKDDPRYVRLRRENLDLPVRNALKLGKDFHPIDNPQGPHGKALPLYDLVLRRVKDRVLKALNGPVRIDLGCGGNAPAGYLGIDWRDVPDVDIVHDLSIGIPLPDNKADEVRAWHFLEHVPDKRFIMGEIWRVLRPGGAFTFEVPSTRGQGAFAHPDHVSYWNRLSFLFYSDNALRAAAGVLPKFDIVRLDEITDEEHDAVYVRGELRAVKPAPVPVEKAALVPFGRFTPPKPRMAVYTETFSPAELWDKWAKKKLGRGLAVEPKLNGFRAIAQKRGGRTDIKFEDSDRSRAKQLAELMDVLKKVPDDFILDCDVGVERRGKRLPRIELMALTADEPALQEGDRVVCTAFDLPYWKEDLSDKPFHERRTALEKFYKQHLRGSKHFAVTPLRVARNEAAFMSAGRWAGKHQASEGAVVKTLDGPYALGGATDEWAKFKHVVEIKAIVLDAQRNRAGGYNYRSGVLLGDAPYSNIVEIDGKKYVDLGKSFSTKVRAARGDVLTVQVHEIIPQRKGDKETLAWLGPTVMDVDKTRKEPFYAKQVVDMARRGRVLQRVEKAGEEGDEVGPRARAAAMNWEKNWQDMLPRSGRGRFVYQHHYRGLSEDEAKLGDEQLLDLERDVSVHGDLRLEGDGGLWGWAVFLGEAADNRDGDKLVTGRQANLQLAPKLAQPKSWLRVGRGAGTVAEPGEPGSTSRKFSKFFIEDQGTYRLGVARVHFVEVFLNGRKLKGRYLLQFAPLGGSRKWIVDKPEDQRPFAETHERDKVVAELKRKGQRWLFWGDGVGRVEVVDVAKAKVEDVSEFVHEVAFSCLDDHERVASGIVLLPDVPDAQGHVMRGTEIEAAAHRYAERMRLDLHHARDVGAGEARVVESWVQREPVTWRFEMDGKTRETHVPAGAWCASVRFGTELWGEVLSGEITGFSPKGWGVLTPVGEEYGGPGSGHHGHKGVPGSRGGSSPSGVMRWEPGGVYDDTEARFSTTYANDVLNEGQVDDWELAEEGVRSDVKAQIVEDLANASGLGQEQVNDAMSTWASTSNNKNPDALAMQKAASEEFGVPLSAWQRDKIKETGLPTGGVLDQSDRRVFLQRTYAMTQETFSNAGVSRGDTIRLYRGIRTPEASPRAGTWKKGDVFDYNGNAIESWSASPNVARDFGRALVMDVPVENIVSSARTGLGCLSEGEFVILGSVPGQRVEVLD